MASTRLATLVAAALAGLGRCPLCERRSNTSAGACQACRTTLFDPGGDGDTLWLGPYRGTLKRCVVALKYRRAHALADLVAAAMADECRRLRLPADLVCPVPQSRRRRRQRGYNQAASIGARLAQRLEIPYRDPLQRNADPGSQVGLTRAQRRRNVERGFGCSIRLPPCQVLLVDDVLTSGATSSACRQALLAAGARRVVVLVAARAAQRPRATG